MEQENKINQFNGSLSFKRRRRWSIQEKEKIVRETYEPGNSVSLVSRKYNISPSMVFQWRRYMEEGASKGIANEEELVPFSEVKKLEQRIRSLERMLGRKTEENEILKEAVVIARKKKLISQEPLKGIEGFQ
jgi:transposase